MIQCLPHRIVHALAWHDETLYHTAQVVFAEAGRLYQIKPLPAPWDALNIVGV